MRALVTGGAGFIGSNLVSLLVAEGHRVTVLDNLSTGYRANLPAEIPLVEGDIRDARLVGDAMKDRDVLFHLGAFVSLPESFERSDECRSINVDGTRNLLEAAAQGRVRRVVFSSTSAVYPELPDTPKGEEDPLEPVSPYASTKLEGERLLQEFRADRGLSYAALRYFNVFGPRQRADSDYAAVIPIFIARCLAGEPLTIYGDGGQTRDFIFVRDVARANLRAALAPQCGVYNVGSGRPLAVLDLARQVCGLLDVPEQWEYEPRRAGDLLSSTAAIDKIRRELDWAPEHSFSDGLAETLEWWRTTGRKTDTS